LVWVLRNPYLPGDWRDLVEHLTFTQVFDRRRIFYTIGPAWYVSLEVMYTFGLAGVGWGAYRLCARVRTVNARVAVLVLLPLLLVVISVAYKVWAFGVAGIPLDHWEVWFGPLARLDAFAMGMLLAVVASTDDAPVSPVAAWSLRLTGLALLVAAFAARDPGSYGDVFFQTTAALAGVLVVGASVLSPAATTWKWALSSRALTSLGVASYSIFLWHEPLMRWLSKRGVLLGGSGALLFNGAAVLVVSAAVAAVSYSLLEFPDGRRRRPQPQPTTA
jgi:peptidoglycan/LPS O-acetylase OafA/YrhL